MTDYIMCKSEKEAIEISKLFAKEKDLFVISCGTVSFSEKGYTHFLEVNFGLPDIIYRFCFNNGIDCKRLLFLEG